MKNYFKKTITVSFFISLIGVFFLTACGVKGPPVPPSYVKPSEVKKLNKEIKKDRLTLSWTIPKKEEWYHKDLDGFIVYRFKEPISTEPCKNCPKKFEAVADVPVGTMAPGDTIKYNEKLENGFRYIYKIDGYTASGDKSKGSDSVEFEY